jgi:hypothetical protein
MGLYVGRGFGGHGLMVGRSYMGYGGYGGYGLGGLGIADLAFWAVVIGAAYLLFTGYF